jgi:TPR repeat protein
MKARISFLLIFILALGLAACTDNETREQKFTHTQRLAQKGDAGAQYNLGLMYDQGYGVSPDARKAAAWFEKAAEKGEANAQYRLGSLYYRGQGVTRDWTRAAQWYKKAAEHGSIPAQAALGNMYLLGEGVLRDSSKAAYWHNKSLKPKNPADFARD